MVNTEDFSKKSDDENVKRPDPSNEETSNELSGDDDWDSDEDHYHEPVFVNCPCCGTGFTELPPDCEHILIEYDASFSEFSCDRFFDNLDDLKSGMMALIESGKNVSSSDLKLQAIWDYAKECYMSNPSTIELNTDLFMDFLSEKYDELGAYKCYMNEEESAPGYSSAYVYYFAESPEAFIQNVTDHILSSYTAV
jgi:hypothetical protein